MVLCGGIVRRDWLALCERAPAQSIFKESDCAGRSGYCVFKESDCASIVRFFFIVFFFL